MIDELRMLTPTPMLGYGFPIAELERGIELNPHLITVDSGSTDSGPHKLGLGHMTCSYEAYYKDMKEILTRAYRKKIPVFISSAGGDGSDKHVDDFIEIIERICLEHHFKMKVAVIYSEIEKDFIEKKIDEKKVKPCGPVHLLTKEELKKSTRIVGQMGAEPYLDVLENNEKIDLIISGRTYDPVPIAVLGIKNHFDPGLCWHLGKIMECGALCAEPAGKGIFGILRRNDFILEPLSLDKKCTVTSVAAHSLYEKGNPIYLPGPGGMLDLSQTTFEQIDERRVKVKGSKFVGERNNTIKIEGSKIIGFRTIFISGIRDPLLIREIDQVIDYVNHTVKDYFSETCSDKYNMFWHVYGKDGVMGKYEAFEMNTQEICLILEVVAKDQDMARNFCSRARTEMLHSPYKGRIGTAGNLAFPFTPLEIDLGPVCEFNIYHLLEIENVMDIIKTRYLEINNE